MKNIIIAIAFLFSTYTTKSLAQQKQDFIWLVGTWKNDVKQNEWIVEVWQKRSDSLYTSKSYFIKNKDTSLQETVKLINENNEWKYIATAANQNDDKPVAFSLIFIGKNEFICTNPAHDYPNRIAYRLANKTQLFASIEGSVKGKYKKGNYDYIKY